MDPNYRLLLGHRIRTARQLEGLTQKQLGLLCGYSEAVAERTVCYWEVGDRAPALDRLRPLSEALKIPLEQLLP